MNHWQNFYHDATAEELDDYVEMAKNVARHCPWLEDECRQVQLMYLPMPRRFLLRTRPVVVC